MKKIYVLLLVLGLSLATVAQAGWEPPKMSPPNCDPSEVGCYTPLNVSGVAQVKPGSIGLGSLTGDDIDNLSNSLYRFFSQNGSTNANSSAVYGWSAGGAGVKGEGGTYGVAGVNNLTTGVAVQAQQGSTGYGFKQVGAGAKNYFQGKLGIGVEPSPNTGPTRGVKLHVREGQAGDGSGQTPDNVAGLFVENDGTLNTWSVFQTATAGGGKSFSVTNAGNVGVGITEPEAKLHVWHSDSEQTPTNIAGLFIENNGTSNAWYALQTATKAGKGLSVTNAGNVGIGIDSPTQRLDVNGNVNVPAGKCFMVAGVCISVPENSGVSKIIAGAGITVNPPSGTGEVTVATDFTKVQQRVTPCPAGQAMQSISQSGTPACLPVGGNNGGTVTGTGTINMVPKWKNSQGNLGNSRIFDNGTGIGIGTITPKGQFEIEGASSEIVSTTISSDRDLGNNDGVDLTMYAYQDDRAEIRVGTDHPLVFSTNSTNGNNERMRITEAGNVGIGTKTPNPAVMLDVAGRVKISGGTPGDGQLLRSDATGAATWENIWMCYDLEIEGGGLSAINVRVLPSGTGYKKAEVCYDESLLTNCGGDGHPEQFVHLLTARYIDESGLYPTDWPGGFGGRKGTLRACSELGHSLVVRQDRAWDSPSAVGPWAKISVKRQRFGPTTNVFID